MPGGPADLVTINPGSNSIDILGGLGGGLFANPVAIPTVGPDQIVRMGDFTGNRVDDVAVLDAAGVSIYLGDGKGGLILPPVTYAAGPDPTGLTVADINRDGKLDLLVGDAYGDVLVLLGNGNGTFQPYQQTDKSIELAVADLTGNGAKDIIYADQSLDRVVVDYGAGVPTVLADQSAGLLDPGAIALADLIGDGIPDLIVANSGGNDVLVYPGLGNGQFGPEVNGGHGYFVGTDPVGITVADLSGGGKPDLVVANKGSNDVSILFNESQGAGLSFREGPSRLKAGFGPVSTVVGDYNGDGIPDMLVTDSESNSVLFLPGTGGGFFNDQNPKPFNPGGTLGQSPQILPVGDGPVAGFVGNFNGRTDLLTVNAGSNDLTLISGFDGPDANISTISSGGLDPVAAFAFDAGNGFEDLVVGNGGDGILALFEGGTDGLSLVSATTEPNVPDPTALAFSALTGGQVQFYAATAGRESAELVTLSLLVESGGGQATDTTNGGFFGSTASTGANPIAQLVPLHEQSLPLVATVLTLSIEVSADEFNLGTGGPAGTTAGIFLPGTGISLGQSPSSQWRSGAVGDEDALSNDPGGGSPVPGPAVILPWERIILGLDEALEAIRRARRERGRR